MWYLLKKIHKLERCVIVGIWASEDREGGKNAVLVWKCHNDVIKMVYAHRLFL